MSKIFASTVIRASMPGGEHGGLYKIDLETKQVDKVISWVRDDILHDLGAGGGDRGMRGIAQVGDSLFISGSRYLFEFNKNYELVNQFDHPKFNGTHEIKYYNGKIYATSNAFDSILVFDVEKREWEYGILHKVGKVQFNDIPRRETAHICSLSILDDTLWYSGSKLDKLWGVNLTTNKVTNKDIQHKGPHDCQHYKGDIVYNLSKESKTVWENHGVWDTPEIPVHGKDSTSRYKYTRGMCLFDDKIVSGTSPASIIIITPETNEVDYIQLEKDVRYSVCCIARNENND